MDCCRNVSAAKTDAECLCDEINDGLSHYRIDCFHGGGAFTVCTADCDEVVCTSADIANAETIARFFDARARIDHARAETREATEILSDIMGVDVAVDVAVNEEWDD